MQRREKRSGRVPSVIVGDQVRHWYSIGLLFHLIEQERSLPLTKLRVKGFGIILLVPERYCAILTTVKTVRLSELLLPSKGIFMQPPPIASCIASKAKLATQSDDGTSKILRFHHRSLWGFTSGLHFYRRIVDF